MKFYLTVFFGKLLEQPFSDILKNNLNIVPYMHGLSEKQLKSKTLFDSNNNMRQLKLKLVTIIDKLYDNLQFT